MCARCLAAMKDYAVKASLFDIITRVEQNSFAKLFQLGIAVCFILVGISSQNLITYGIFVCLRHLNP